MPNTINEELAELASEFTAVRLSGRKSWFPDNIWKKAIIIANKLPISAVCQAIKVHPGYLRKKISDFDSSNTKPLTFLEIPQRIRADLNTITIVMETSRGHKLKIDGAATSCLCSLISEFFKEGKSCCR